MSKKKTTTEWWCYLNKWRNGSLLRHCSVSCHSSSPLQTELLAILLAVLRPLHFNFNVAFIYTDCLNAIMQLVGRSEPHFADIFLSRNLRHAISKLVFWRIYKVDRKDSSPAHCLAKRDMLSSSTSTDARGTPFWTEASADLQALFL